MTKMSALRDISFTEYLEFDFQGSVAKNAICLGDIDNDGFNELVVGNDKGEVSVFKGESSKPVYICKTSAIITSITLGDVLNCGRNILIVITACGQCSLFDFNKDIGEDTSKKFITPFHIQRIPANVKVAHVGDINGDEFSELVVGLTDRVVRTFRWVSASKNLKDKVIGKLVGLNKWEFAEQIGSITLHKSMDGNPCILVAQPNGSFITLNVNSTELDQPIEPLDESMGDFLTKISMNLEPLTSAKLRNSEMCGNITNKKTEDANIPSLAVATLDGVLMLVRKKNVLWKRLMECELFSVNSIDITKDGNEEVVACSWDGNTYIVTHKNEGVHFAFHEPVNTFTAGLFGLQKKQTSCLVYVTFCNKIYVYYDVYINYIAPKTVVEVLKENSEYLNLVQNLGINLNDSVKLKKLNKNVLYKNCIN